MDLGDKVCLVDPGDAVMSWHWEPLFPGTQGFPGESAAPYIHPLTSANPQTRNSAGVPALVAFLRVQNQIGALFRLQASCLGLRPG